MKRKTAADLIESLGKYGLIPGTIKKFRDVIYRQYYENPRNLPWRKTRNPYMILVSEVMLQQTQVERVNEKYTRFIQAFPDFHTLSKASLYDLLKVWQGLGYNRRALSLKRTARIVMTEYKGKLPPSERALLRLPGIGRYTASAICAFAYNQPAVFIETNIRRVFIHFFFPHKANIKDREIFPLIDKAIDRSNPREWYYALMDYGVMLKKVSENPNRRSAHYQKQTPFGGSNRRIRGMILKILIEKPGLPLSGIVRELDANPERIKVNIDQLKKEGFLKETGNRFVLC